MGEAKIKHLIGDDTPTVSINPTSAEQILSRGDAEEAFRTILSEGCRPGDRKSRQMLAMMHLRNKRMDEAKKLLDELHEERADFLSCKMFGDYWFLVNDYVKAQNWYGRALGKEPKQPDTVHDYAVALASQGRVENAIPSFRECCELAPNRPDFKHHLAIMLLLAGHETEGWRMMDSRLHYGGITGTFPQPEKYWQGQHLKGKKIVVRTEQGFGDTIQFLRYLKPIQLMDPWKIYVYCQPEMVGFIEKFYPFVEPWQHKAPPPLDFDYHVNVMSLPQHFPGAYFTEPRQPARPGADGIALNWFGSPTHKADHLRTTGIEPFLKLMEEMPEKRWLCGAYGMFDDQKPKGMEYFVHRCRHWGETADAFSENVRLVITVDTAVAHLGGFLGIETWLLLPYVPDFRWGLQGETTPWYESVKLYRQPKLFDWKSVFERVRNDLKALDG